MNLKHLSAIVTILAASTAFGQRTQESGGVPGSTENRNARGVQTETQGGTRNSQGSRDSAQGQPVTGERNSGGQIQNDRGNMDSHIAQCLLIGNQEEVAINQFAQQQTQDQQIKDLAQHMIQDHQAFIQKLQRFANSNSPAARGVTRDATEGATAGEAALVRDRNPLADAARSPDLRGPREQGGATAGTAGTTRTGAATEDQQTIRAGYAPSSDPSIEVERQVSQKCLQMTKEDLQKEQGKDFNKAFLGQQCVMHTQMIAKLGVFQEHASPELAQVLREGEQTARQHKEHIESAMKSMKHEHSQQR